MRLTLAVVVLCGTPLSGAAFAQSTATTAGADEWSYEITIRVDPTPQADIAARFRLTDSGELRLTMPEGWAFVRLPEPLLGGPVECTSGGAALAVERAGPYAWRLALDGRRECALKYSVPLTHRELAAVKGRHAFEYPFVAADHGMLATAALLLTPERSWPAHCTVRFHVPAGWDVCAPWPEAGAGTYAPPSAAALANDLVAVGAWTRYELRVGAFVATIAIAPGQPELSAAAVEPIRQIVTAELELFGQPAQGHYLFIFGPPAGHGMGGSPKTHSMTLTVDPRMAARGLHHLAHLIAHEFFHTWTQSRYEMPDELRWLNEGITDYYALLVPARLGLLSWEQFAERLGQKMETAATSPRAGQLSLVDAGGPVFFQDQDAYELVYAGGTLVGAWLDCMIRSRDDGRSLDDLMRDFMNDPRGRAAAGSPTLADFEATLADYVTAEQARAVLHEIRAPYRLDPIAALLPYGIAVARQTAPHDHGLRANFDGVRILDIDPDCAAYRAGLRAADVLLEIGDQPVRTADEVRAAWRALRDQQVRAKVQRAGETLALDAPLPRETRFVVPVEPWRGHLATRARATSRPAAAGV